MYVSFSDMSYASKADLATLVRHNIVERCPDPQKSDLIRLVNFTE